MICTNLDCNLPVVCKEKCNKHYKLQWQQNNIEKRKESLKKYNNSNKAKETHKNYHKTFKGRYAYLLHSLKRYGKIYECTLTLENYCNLIKEQKCHYCDGPIFMSAYATGLDRIDNKLGYHLDNVLPCCGECNKLRGDRLSVDETKEIVNLLKKLRNTENIWSEAK